MESKSALCYCQILFSGGEEHLVDVGNVIVVNTERKKMNDYEERR